MGCPTFPGGVDPDHVARGAFARFAVTVDGDSEALDPRGVALHSVSKPASREALTSTADRAPRALRRAIRRIRGRR